jgi:hypothetical protein
LRREIDAQELTRIVQSELASVVGVSQDVISGSFVLRYNERDMRRFYVITNALYKKSRRLMRRYRAHLSKMARRGRINHVLRRY